MYYIGIDSGSTNTKFVLYQDDIIDVLTLPTSWSALKTATLGVETLITNNQITQPVVICTTGYGRESIDFADNVLTEITAHGLGGNYLDESITGIIDIGGQDCKVIALKNGKVIDFVMNDKCAAGTGSFLEMVCQKLEIPLDEIDDFIEDGKYVDIVSMCAVFAQSEIVSLIANNTNRSQILLGVIVSIAKRIEQLLAKLSFNNNDVLLLTGGLANSKIVAQVLEQECHIKIINDEYSIYAGAIGAALHGKNKS